LSQSFPFLFRLIYIFDNNSKEKWDASGGNEALGRVTASIPDSTKAMLGNMFKKENLRGPSVFFGIGEERPYYVEKTPSLLAERLRHNFTFFYLNYLLIAVVLFCLTLLVNPSALIGIALLGGLWVWLIRASADGTLRISSESSRCSLHSCDGLFA
jgi:PRA1 family protein